MRQVLTQEIKDSNNLIINTSVSEDAKNQIIGTMKDFFDEYGLKYNNTREANIVGSDSGTLAFYDGSGVTFNAKYLNGYAMQNAMKECEKSGFHPPLGGKTGLEAVAAHELGHSLNDLVAQKLGTTLDGAAKKIFREANKNLGSPDAHKMAGAISGYAKSSNAEAIAEAIADCYCNGKNAKAESIAIKVVVDKYLK